MAKKAFDKLTACITDTRIVIIFISTIIAVIVTTQGFTQLPGRVEDVEASIEKVKVKVVDNKNSVAELAHTIERYVEVNATHRQAQEEREQLMTQLLMQAINK